YIAEHNRDMIALGIKEPQETPRATEHINGMISLAEKLIAKGMAYAVDGDVYFAVDKFYNYGKLSGRNTEELLAGARVDIGEKKKNPLDFALWKASKENEPWWESPWGKGRPGWHIECSVMSQCFLGSTFDIHGGGADLIFPHHENEIAQSEGANEKTLANYWLHNGFVRISGEKMSKSLNNFLTIREMLELYHHEVLRFFMLQFHYRSPVDFSHDALAEARSALNRCYRLLEVLQNFVESSVSANDIITEKNDIENNTLFEKISMLPTNFTNAMDDDFNTAKAFGIIFDVVREVNNAIADKKFIKSTQAKLILQLAQKNIVAVGNVLGLFTCAPDEYFIQDKQRETQKLGLDLDMIETQIATRSKAREEKNWQLSDEIRNNLATLKVQLKDGSAGTTWCIE
ncbi:MAG: cysteine--tRNA ligase, partial [Deltaproteobacteria bacterium]